MSTNNKPDDRTVSKSGDDGEFNLSESNAHSLWTFAKFIFICIIIGIIARGCGWQL